MRQIRRNLLRKKIRLLENLNMVSDFVHLHLHSDYSLLDGACSVNGIIEMALENKMTSVAMTDHGFMGGAIEFYQKFAAKELKPIIGCEAYVSPTSRFDRDPNIPHYRGFHLVLLAKDETGYASLCKLLSDAHMNGYYYKPRIDKEILAQHHKGLIGLSACIQGEISRTILEGKIKESKNILGEYLDILGRDNFYLELMDHGMEEERIVNKELLLLSKEFEVPVVATNDVHYLRKEHSKSHEMLLCIQTQSKFADEKRFRFPSNEFYFKSADEMKELFKEVPEAISNTLEVAERCNLEFKFAPDVNHYPVYELPDKKMTEKEYLRSICVEGIQERYDFDASKETLSEEEQKIVDRMDFELGVIDSSHYCSYFLVVWDFLLYARKIKVPVGPGRGSGAGSLVAYLTHITDIEPLRYNLLFERFLNPDRVSPPDFDIDFCERRRVEIIEYVRNKYGSENVAQIGTYGTLKAKAVLKDVARVLGHSFAEGDMITKLIPNDPKMNLAKAKQESKELRELIENEQWVAEIFKYAEPLEGINRNMSIHAAGVIIGDQRLDNLVPLAKGSSNEMITEFSAVPCEDLGLLKMDFLGLRTLTVIQDAVDNIKKARGLDIDMAKIPLDDQPSFDLLNKGDTVGVFQLESTGMQSLCRQFGVESIEHIIALIAIYRPGPMQFIPEFVGRKMGQMPIEYDHPKMKQYLEETYGIMLYQEQIMQVVQVLAGFSLGQADILRRAMGKKKVKVMEEQKAKFVEGCAKTNNIDEKIANRIWEKIAMFAGYGFNKSHSAAYAFLAYRTAYLKANYPVELMSAVMTSELNNAEKLTFFINECREMGIKILPPDINVSFINFTVDKDSTRFGLGAIKGVGEAAANAIIEARQNDGPFTSFMDLCERAGSSLNTRMLEHLIRSGAFDGFGLKRSQLIAIIEETMALATRNIKDKESDQGDFFMDILSDEDGGDAKKVNIPDLAELDESEMLKDEKQFLGFYVSGHPLGKFAEKIDIYSTTNLKDAHELPDNTGIKVGGIIRTAMKRLSKKDGKPYAILELEDLNGSMECMVYNGVFEKPLNENHNPNEEIDDNSMEYDMSIDSPDGPADPSKDLFGEEVKGRAILAQKPATNGNGAQENGAPIFVKDLLNEDEPVFIEGLISQRDENDNKKIIIQKIMPLPEVAEKHSKEVHLHIYEGSTTQETLGKIKGICDRNAGTTRVIICITCATGEIAFIETSTRNNIKVSDRLLNDVQEVLGERRYKIKPDTSVPPPRRKFQPKFKNEEKKSE